MKKITSDYLADRALGDMVKYCDKHHGSIEDVTERMIKLSGQTIFRQQVGMWLHPDPKKRREPRFGMGLLLLEVWEQPEMKQFRGKDFAPSRRLHSAGRGWT